MADQKEFTITLRWDSGHNNVLAFVTGTSQELCSAWHLTPEAALVDLCEKCRLQFTHLSGMSIKGVEEDGKNELYVWLARTFGSGK